MTVHTVEKVGVDLLTASVNFTVNMVFKGLLEIVRERGLSLYYLTNERECIEKGLFVWLSEESLQFLLLEVSRPESDKALEVFQFDFIYHTDPLQEVEKLNVEKLREFCRKLRTLPEGVSYQVKVNLESWASEVPGWGPCEFKELNEAEKAILDSWGYGDIGTSLVYLGSEWW